MIIRRPSRENAIYKAFKTLRNYKPKTNEERALLTLAEKLVESIALQEYPKDPCIIGAMIIMDDIEEMEKEGVL